MANLVQTYAIHDSNPAKGGGAKRINIQEAHDWNKRGYGIFWTVNAFKGSRRIESLTGINAWAIDLDKGTKAEMLSKIEKGLVPTLVVETKSGFHVYWKAKNGTKENWKAIVQNRLVPFYGADRRAKDLARLLRRPGFLHLKDPVNPFLIQKVWQHPVEYSEEEMLGRYPDVITPKLQRKIHRMTVKGNPMQGGFWERVWNLDCEYALTRLSGTEHVGFETYEFKPNASGTKNIYINGKSSSCWVDHNRRIGSADGGGPTIAQWLNWFHKDYKKTVQIIKEVFPECQDKKLLTLTS